MDRPAGSESVLAVTGVQTAAKIIDEVIDEAHALLAHGGTAP